MSRLVSTTHDIGPHLLTFQKGIDEFNRGLFWECHETWEEVWREQQGPVQDFYKGLIQVAAGLHHLSRGNLRGVDIVLGRAMAYLESFAPHCLGVDVAGLIAGAARCREAALALGEERLAEFDSATIPQITFEPSEAHLHPASGLVRANGVTLHFWDWGGDGRPVIFLHGNGFLGRIWQPIAEALSPRYRVLALDQRGHGDSDASQADYDWHHFVDDLPAFVEALGIERPVAVGHSLGGAAAAYAEIQSPGIFSGVVLVDPIIAPKGSDAFARSSAVMAERARKRRLLWSSRQEMFESYRPREPFNTWREDILQLYVNWGARASRERGVILKCSGEVEAQVYENYSSLDTFERLTEIQCPSLLICGERRESASLARDHEVTARLCSGRLVTIPGTSHFVPMEKPDAVAQTIEGFLTGLA